MAWSFNTLPPGPRWFCQMRIGSAPRKKLLYDMSGKRSDDFSNISQKDFVVQRSIDLRFSWEGNFFEKDFMAASINFIFWRLECEQTDKKGESNIQGSIDSNIQSTIEANIHYNLQTV